MNEQSSQNDNSKTPEFSEQDLSNLASELKKESPNKNLLKEIAQSTNLTPEEIKQTFPNLEKEWKGDRVEPVKTATDQEKINAYDKLNVKELPTDWELQLARLKHLESELSNYVKVKEELKGWTDTFSEKKPSEVQGEIKQLEEKQTKTEEEAKEKITELEQKLTTANQEKTQTNQDLSAKIRELEGELKEWEQTFDNLQLIEAKEIWEGFKTTTRYSDYRKWVLRWLCEEKKYWSEWSGE